MTEEKLGKKKSRYRILAALIGLFFVVLVASVILLGVGIAICGSAKS